MSYRRRPSASLPIPPGGILRLNPLPALDPTLIDHEAERSRANSQIGSHISSNNLNESSHSDQSSVLDDFSERGSNAYSLNDSIYAKSTTGLVEDSHPHVNGSSGSGSFLSAYDPTGCLLMGISLCSWLFSEKGTNDDEVSFSSRGPVHPGAKLMEVSRLVTAPLSDELYYMLAEPERMAKPTLAFATYRDGWSMENLLEKTRDKEPVLLLIRSLKNSYIIGAFSTSKLSPPSRLVRGDGECFVFRLSGPPGCKAKAYKWFHNPAKNKSSNTSEQFLVATREYIAFGASHEHGTNALRLDGDLVTCSSGPSDTYHNKHSLTPDEDGPFQVRDIEVIQLGERRTRRSRMYSPPR